MRAFLLLLLVVVLLGGGLKLAGVPLPLIDYPIGPIGIEADPRIPEIQVEAPGFDDADALP